MSAKSIHKLTGNLFNSKKFIFEKLCYKMIKKDRQFKYFGSLDKISILIHLKKWYPVNHLEF